jgi:hypothetical protein
MHNVNKPSLAEHAILANLRIRQWTARRLDKSASVRTADLYGAEIEAVRVHKSLLPKTSLARVQTAVSSARARHDALTLPWGMRGQSILAMPGFMKYRDAMADHESEFDSAVREFCRAYPDLHEQARKTLGEMFQYFDYPQADKILERYSFHTFYMPIPSGNDFRVNLPDAVREAVDADQKTGMADALRTVYARIVDSLTKLSDGLNRYEPGTDGARAKGSFHGTLITNVRELAADLPALNIFGDSRIDAMGSLLADLTKFDAKELKESDAIRADIAGKAAQAVADISADIDSAISDYL